MNGRRRPGQGRRGEGAAERATARISTSARYAADTAGPFATVISGLSERQRQALGVQLVEPFAAFVADEGYELPALALCAVAS